VLCGRRMIGCSDRVANHPSLYIVGYIDADPGGECSIRTIGAAYPISVPRARRRPLGRHQADAGSRGASQSDLNKAWPLFRSPAIVRVSRQTRRLEKLQGENHDDAQSVADLIRAIAVRDDIGRSTATPNAGRTRCACGRTRCACGCAGRAAGLWGANHPRGGKTGRGPPPRRKPGRTIGT
jgi:hypothetical protein